MLPGPGRIMRKPMCGRAVTGGNVEITGRTQIVNRPPASVSAVDTCSSTPFSRSPAHDENRIRVPPHHRSILLLGVSLGACSNDDDDDDGGGGSGLGSTTYAGFVASDWRLRPAQHRIRQR
jgi:hypothetical protein